MRNGKMSAAAKRRKQEHEARKLAKRMEQAPVAAVPATALLIKQCLDQAVERIRAAEAKRAELRLARAKRREEEQQEAQAGDPS